MPKTHPRRYRIESLILQALAPMLTSALPGGIITLRHVSLNKDFSTATIIYTVVGDRQQAQQNLDKHAWHYRRQLANSLNMRKTPQLVFIYDSDGLGADKVRAFLEKIKLNDDS